MKRGKEEGGRQKAAAAVNSSTAAWRAANGTTIKASSERESETARIARAASRLSPNNNRGGSKRERERGDNGAGDTEFLHAILPLGWTPRRRSREGPRL